LVRSSRCRTSDVEIKVLSDLYSRRRTFAAGLDLVHQGQADQSCCILVRGWVCSYKILPESTRQIVDFQIPGDFPGLRQVLSDTLGLSAVHVNRVLRQLREDGLLTFQKGEVVFDDLDRLIEFADFDRDYLDHDGPLLKQGSPGHTQRPGDLVRVRPARESLRQVP
jgi:CRP-like cAMP-binding protein